MILERSKSSPIEHGTSCLTHSTRDFRGRFFVESLQCRSCQHHQCCCEVTCAGKSMTVRSSSLFSRNAEDVHEPCQCYVLLHSCSYILGAFVPNFIQTQKQQVLLSQARKKDQKREGNTRERLQGFVLLQSRSDVLCARVSNLVEIQTNIHVGVLHSLLK